CVPRPAEWGPKGPCGPYGPWGPRGLGELPRCASAIQILRPSESIAATQPQLHPALLSVSNYFPILHLELCSRHCLLFNTSPNDSEQHDGNDSSPSQEGLVPIKLTYRHQLCRAGRVFPL